METIKLGTDFSGIGSPESALKRLGLDIDEVFACEIDKFARASFNELHNPTTMYEDITTRNHSEVPQLDLYVAGFPCQSFSLAGKRGGFEDTRGTLFFNVAEFIKENQPKCFVLENVKGLLSHDNGRTYQTITDVLTNGGGTLNGQIGLDSIDNGLGYHVYAQVLNSKDYGIPQNRERIFLVGFKEFREFRFPKKMELKLRLKDLLEQEVDVKYYLSEKMIEGFTLSRNNNTDIVGDLNKGGERGVVYNEDCSIMSCLTATDYKQPKQILVNTNNKRVNQNFLSHIEDLEDGDFMDSYNQTIHKEVIPTMTCRISASHNYHIYKTNRIRRLTPLECWRLQGYTDEQFNKAQKVNSDSQLYKQAGNSITVDVMVELFKTIYDI